MLALSKEDSMIELQHIWKQFGSRIIFSDLNLNFQSGIVYALIGVQWLWKNHFAQYASKTRNFR